MSSPFELRTCSFDQQKAQMDRENAITPANHRGRPNMRNYFYAQRHKSAQYRALNCSSKQSPRFKNVVEKPQSKEDEQNNVKNMGIMGPFYVSVKPNWKSTVTYSATKKLKKQFFSEKISLCKQSPHKEQSFIKCQKQNKVYDKIVVDMNNYLSAMKLTSYVNYQQSRKRKSDDSVSSKKKKSDDWIQDILAAQNFGKTSNELKIRGLKPFLPNYSLIVTKEGRSHKTLTESMNTEKSHASNVKYRPRFSSADKLGRERGNKSLRASTIDSHSNLVSVNYLGRIKDSMLPEQKQKLKWLYYKDFIWKQWFNADFKVVSTQTPRYFIGRGNNSRLIKTLMNKRWWWKLEIKEENANFLWTQLKIYSAYQSQQSYSTTLNYATQSRQHMSLSNPNDRNLCILTVGKYLIWRKHLSGHAKAELKNTENLQSRKQLEKSFVKIDTIADKVSNHLQFSRLIGNKKALYKTVSLYHKLLGGEPQHLPVTYHITSGLEDDEYLRFLNEYYHRAKNYNKTMWIVKPGEMSNRGNGIRVCKSLAEIKEVIKAKKNHGNGKPFTYIIQEYIDNPFLYEGRKFDIRHFMMIISRFGRLQAYFYDQGYIRTTSYKYDKTNESSSVHLTNDAVQKRLKDYGKYEKGNKLSYQFFHNYLQQEYQGKYSFYGTILPKIRQICIEIARSSYYLIDPKRRGHNFEIYGLDVMLDSKFRPWLIEVNTNPCLELSSNVLARLIPKMLDNALAY